MDLRLRHLEQITICLIKIIMKKPLGCQGALWLKRNKFCYYFLQKSLLY
nr:MAG TPA: hypothetical protein [Caudoviricetes sp.]